jgi:hypothetical protein
MATKIVTMPNRISPIRAQKRMRASGREVAARRVAGGPEAGDEQRRRCAGLPDRLRIGACVVAERWSHRESDEQTEPE